MCEKKCFKVRVVVFPWQDAELRVDYGPWPLLSLRCYYEEALYAL